MNLKYSRRQTSYANWLLSISLLALLIVGAGCGPAAEEVNTNSEDAAAQPTTPLQSDTPALDDAYPGLPEPTPAENSDEAYPPPQDVPESPQAYPAPTDEPSGILLSFDRPVKPGSTTVTGEGPPGLLVFILNVTLMGELEGSGVIGDDGRFSISVAPLEENVRLGITSESAMQGQTEDDVRPGEGEMGIPQVGYFYDTVMVR